MATNLAHSVEIFSGFEVPEVIRDAFKLALAKTNPDYTDYIERSFDVAAAFGFTQLVKHYARVMPVGEFGRETEVSAESIAKKVADPRQVLASACASAYYNSLLIPERWLALARLPGGLDDYTRVRATEIIRHAFAFPDKLIDLHAAGKTLQRSFTQPGDNYAQSNINEHLVTALLDAALCPPGQTPALKFILRRASIDSPYLTRLEAEFGKLSPAVPPDLNLIQALLSIPVGRGKMFQSPEDICQMTFAQYQQLRPILLQAFAAPDNGLPPLDIDQIFSVCFSELR